MFIVVDCGTTNMRCSLYNGQRLVDSVRRQAGGRNTAFDGNSNALSVSLRECINELLAKNGFSHGDIEVVISSGILASDIGTYPIPHVTAPAGAEESARHARLTVIGEITSIPILFIPGIKVLPDTCITDETEKIALWDSMSGEECEIYGTVKLMGLSGELTVCLPGSYNKTLRIDAEGRIIAMRTGMCGEFIAAMSEHTILKKSLPHPVIQRIIPERLIQGFELAGHVGVSPAMIKARLVRTLGGWGADDAANFFVGALLHDDIRVTASLCSPSIPLVLGGSEPLRTVFGVLLRNCGIENIIEVPTEVASIAPNIGAITVYEKFIQNKNKNRRF